MWYGLRVPTAITPLVALGRPDAANRRAGSNWRNLGSPLLTPINTGVFRECGRAANIDACRFIYRPSTAESSFASVSSIRTGLPVGCPGAVLPDVDAVFVRELLDELHDVADSIPSQGVVIDSRSIVVAGVIATEQTLGSSKCVSPPPLCRRETAYRTRRSPNGNQG